MNTARIIQNGNDFTLTFDELEMGVLYESNNANGTIHTLVRTRGDKNEQGVRLPGNVYMHCVCGTNHIGGGWLNDAEYFEDSKFRKFDGSVTLNNNGVE